MLNRGFSMVELMVTVGIMAFLMAMGAPAFSNWMTGSRIRANAESMLAGLQYAKSEAASRNTQVRFQLTTTVDANCQRSINGTSWVVDVVDSDAATDSVEGQCNAPVSDTNAPSILQVRNGTESSGSTVINADANAIVFNGLGRPVPALNAPMNIEITPVKPSDCAINGGKVTCLRVAVSPAGQIRMCNPKIPAGEPAACS